MNFGSSRKVPVWNGVTIILSPCLSILICLCRSRIQLTISTFSDHIVLLNLKDFKWRLHSEVVVVLCSSLAGFVNSVYFTRRSYQNVTWMQPNRFALIFASWSKALQTFKLKDSLISAWWSLTQRNSLNPAILSKGESRSRFSSKNSGIL